MTHAIQWFEIPVRNMDAAVPFYEAVVGGTLLREIFGGMPYAIFPSSAKEPPANLDGVIRGALVVDAKRTPGSQGPTIYLATKKPIEEALAAAVAHGGKVLLPVTPIGKDGAIAIFLDLDGNAIGLNQPA